MVNRGSAALNISFFNIKNYSGLLQLRLIVVVLVITLISNMNFILNLIWKHKNVCERSMMMPETQADRHKHTPTVLATVMHTVFL